MTKRTSTFILFGLCLLFAQTSTAQCGSTCSTPSIQNPPPDMFILCGEPLPPLIDLMYDNGETGACANSGFIQGIIIDNTSPCFGGTVIYDWNGQDACGNFFSHVQTITVDPPQPAMFINYPTDIVLSCGDALPPLTDLYYDNNEPGFCANAGTIPGIIQGNSDPCTGGTITYTWSGTDACGNPLQHTQTIIINPPPTATIQNPPADWTINCGDNPPPLTNLTYDNGAFGACASSGTLAGTQVDNTNGCQGGTIVYTWSGVDACGNLLQHTQTITVAPAPVTIIQNPPIDMTLICGDIVPPLVNLTYDNGSPGCPASGTLVGTQSGSTDPCQGGTLVRTWIGQDACGNTLSHTQTILFTTDICDVNNGLPTNQQIEGNLCVAGSVHASQAMRLKPMTTPPSSPLVGTMYFDDNTKKLRVWDGAVWQSCW